MPRLRSLVAALALVVAAPACTTAGPQESCARTAAKVPSVKLVSPGQEPREPLRVAVTDAHRETMVMTMKMAMAMDIDGAPVMPYTKLPATVMTMGMDVAKAEQSGDFRYDFALDAIDVQPTPESPPAMVDAIRTAMADLKGLGGNSRLSNRGEVCEAAFKVPDNVSPQVKQTMDGMQQSLQQIAVPFPEEAVGVGARWEVVTKLDHAQGMELTQTSTYEIVGRRGSEVDIKTTITQHADPQKMNPPGLPPGASVQLESMESSGSGTTTFDLTKVAPQAGSLILNSKIAMIVEAMGQKQAMKMTMDLDLTLGAGK